MAIAREVSGLVVTLIMSLTAMLIVLYIDYARNLVVDSQLQTACFDDELISIQDSIPSKIPLIYNSTS